MQIMQLRKHVVSLHFMLRDMTKHVAHEIGVAKEKKEDLLILTTDRRATGLIPRNANSPLFERLIRLWSCFISMEFTHLLWASY